MESEIRPISDAERDVLKVLWEQGPSTVRQLRDRLRDRGRKWAHTTVITLLARLEAKGYATSDKSRFAHVFHAAVSRDQLVEQQLSGLADEFCEGDASPLVLALIKDQRFSQEDLERFRRLIDDLDANRGRKRKK